jgi:hypothetical protein
VGYDVYITRAQHWSDNEGHQIAPEEWIAVVQDDPELALAEQYGPCFALWSGTSKYRYPWLDWYDGNVFTKNPDRKIVEKMVQLAQQLNATVQGDDGEVYTSGTALRWVGPNGNAYEQRTKRWWERLFRG